jgi:transcriptional regulator with PAS, ATPase and Fis domain
MLCHNDWPGNIRELENTIERLAIMCQDDMITHHYLQASASNQIGLDYAANPQLLSEYAGDLKEALNKLEREMVGNAYRQTGCTRKAGELLGINQSTVVKKMKKHGLSGNRLL